MKKDQPSQFITRYKFSEDKSKPNRTLDTAKVGGVYVSRLTMQPGVVSGNLYHKETNIIFFVTKGKVRSEFVDIKTEEMQVVVSEPGSGIVHHPPGIAIAAANVSDDESVMVFFSNKPLRADDDFEYSVHDVK